MSTQAPSNTPIAKTSPVPKPESAKAEVAGQILFHYAECTNCHNLLPISTNTEKYFAILASDPSKVIGLGERCSRCGADSWKIVKG